MAVAISPSRRWFAGSWLVPFCARSLGRLRTMIVVVLAIRVLAALTRGVQSSSHLGLSGCRGELADEHCRRSQEYDRRSLERCRLDRHLFQEWSLSLIASLNRDY